MLNLHVKIAKYGWGGGGGCRQTSLQRFSLSPFSTLMSLQPCIYLNLCGSFKRPDAQARYAEAQFAGLFLLSSTTSN